MKLELTDQALIDFRFWLFETKGIYSYTFNEWKYEKQLGYYLEFFKGKDFIKGLYNGLEYCNKIHNEQCTTQQA